MGRFVDEVGRGPTSCRGWTRLVMVICEYRCSVRGIYKKLVYDLMVNSF